MATVGTVTISKKNSFDGVSVTADWIADASGDVSGWNIPANGYLYQIEMNPGTATDLYDVTLLDGDDLDLLSGTGANMSNAAGMTLAEKYFNSPQLTGGNYYLFLGENLELVIANAGAAGTGSITFKFTRSMR